jgi:ferredoxin, 2Fe-2S
LRFILKDIFQIIDNQQFMATVKFTFEDKELVPKTVYAESGYSILEITEEHDVHLNHNCGGVCACSTCHVYVLKGDEFLEEISDKEEDFIDRARNPRIESRLGCQCVILDEDAVIEIEIPSQKGIIGHEH